MFNLLTKWFRKPTNVKRKSVRVAHRFRATLEALESRELLSATIPGYTLTNGNLYHTTGAQRKLIDTAVQNFTVVNNKVFDLHTNNTLDSMNSDGSGKRILDSSVVKFVVGSNGNCYT